MTKVISFEENFPLYNPEIWYSFTNDEGLDISSYAHTQIKFKDIHNEIQNQYYQPLTEKFPSLCHPDNFEPGEVGYDGNKTEYEYDGGGYIYRVRDGFYLTNFSKLCVLLCAITYIAAEFKHSPSHPWMKVWNFFGFDDYDDFYHTDYYESNILTIGQQLADLYEDFYQSSKNFEKKFNDKDYLKETGISITNFELKKERSASDLDYPPDIYCLKCNINFE